MQFLHFEVANCTRIFKTNYARVTSYQDPF